MLTYQSGKTFGVKGCVDFGEHAARCRVEKARSAEDASLAHAVCKTLDKPTKGELKREL